MSTPDTATPTQWPVAVGLSVAGSLVVGLVVLAFLWPVKTSTPQNIPVGIAGPSAAVTAFEGAASQNAPGRFDFVAAADRDEAVDQIETRETYGAILLAAPPATPEVLTASAGSVAVSQILAGVASQLQAQLAAQVVAAGGDPSATKVIVTDIVALSEDDPNGAGLAAAAFPLTIGGMLGGILISLLVVGAGRRVTALVAFATMSGLLLALILQVWFGFLQGSYGLNASAISLGILAISSFVAGCASMVGRPGLGAAAAFTMLFANPLAAAAAPWQFLPEPWGAIGQLLPPGAANALIRTLSYFPDAPTTKQWSVLAAWALLGIGLTVGARMRSPSA